MRECRLLVFQQPSCTNLGVDTVMQIVIGDLCVLVDLRVMVDLPVILVRVVLHVTPQITLILVFLIAQGTLEASDI